MGNYQRLSLVKPPLGITFKIFLLWSFMLLSRPQDIFPFIVPLRPILLIEAIVIPLFVINCGKLVDLTIRKDKQFKLYTALIFIIFLSIPFSYYARLSFLFLTKVYIHAVLFFFISVNLINTVRKAKLLILCFCFGMFIYSLFTILNGTFVEGRIGIGQMFDPNDLAFVLVSCWPLNFIFISKDNAWYLRIYGCFGALLGTAVIILTASRGGILALSLVFALLILKIKYTINKSTKVIIVITSSLILFNFSSMINIDRIMTITNINSDYNLSDETGRIEIWKTGFRLMLTHPLSGVGTACFNEAIGRDRAKRGFIEIWQAPHNSFVQIGTETGIFGLILFISLSWNALSIFRRIKDISEDDQLNKIGEMLTIGFYGHLLATMFLSQAYSIYWVFFIVFSIIIRRLAFREIVDTPKI